MENMRTLVSGQAGDCKCHWEGRELFRAKIFPSHRLYNHNVSHDIQYKGIYVCKHRI